MPSDMYDVFADGLDEEKQGLVDKLPPKGYFWVNQTLDIVGCYNCGACIFNGVSAQNLVLTHDLWHAQQRNLYKVVQMKLGGLNGGI